MSVNKSDSRTYFYLAAAAFGTKILLNYTFLKDAFIDTVSSLAISIIGRSPEAILFGINTHEKLIVALELIFLAAIVTGTYLHFRKSKTVTYSYTQNMDGESKGSASQGSGQE